MLLNITVKKDEPQLRIKVKYLSKIIDVEISGSYRVMVIGSWYIF